MSAIFFYCDYSDPIKYDINFIEMSNLKMEQINNLLRHQNQLIRNMNLFPEEENNDSFALPNNSNLKHKTYRQKILLGEDMIKQVKKVNQQKVELIRKGALKKYGNVRQVQTRNIDSTVHQQQQISPSKINSKNQSIIQSQVQDQISIIQQHKRSSASILPPQITSHEIGKSVSAIQFLLVKDYFKEKLPNLTSSTTPQQIYNLMNPFYVQCEIKIVLPLIKKYTNCVYFGNPSSSPQTKYQGFLLKYQENKMYYGQFLNQKKNGKGTEIDFKRDIIYIGNYTKGKKEGSFTVIKPNQTYIGSLLQEKYEGYGELTTLISIYKGHFEKGLRHGYGQESFLQTGLTLCGTFSNNRFNNQQVNQQSRLSNIKSHTPSNSNISNRSKARNVNPQEKLVNLGKGMIFEPSQISRHHFQQFECAFGQQQEEFQVKYNKEASFRIRNKKSDINKIQKRIPNWQQTSKLSFNSIFKK